tara:strand:- start:806 stop:1483 length:678 start_codon:yes stop_codon:yes gene_type:complete
MSEKRKVLAIGIDGTIRDLFSQFDNFYRRTFIRNDSLVQMNDNFQYVESPEETEEEKLSLQREIDEKINLPLDTFDLLNHYHFDTREDLESFMYTDCSFQIFGSSHAFPKSMDSANFLQIFGDVSNLFDVVLFAKCKNTSIVSTYHFLAKNACKIKNISFVNEYEDIWDFADVVISDCPQVFETKPENKKCIKINHMYNSYSQADYSFDSITEIKNEEFIKSLFK